MMATAARPSSLLDAPWLALGLLSALALCIGEAFSPMVAIFGTVPLLYALWEIDARKALGLGIVCGAGEACAMAGVSQVHWDAWALLVATYALVRGAFCVLAHSAVSRRPKKSAWLPLIVAACWVLTERAATFLPLGFPTLLGDTQHSGPLLPLARLGGTYAISFTMVWWSALWAWGLRVWVRDPSNMRVLRPALAVAWAVTVLALCASYSLSPVPQGHRAVLVVQGGLDGRDYRAPPPPGEISEPEELYTGLTLDAPAAELTIWPPNPLFYDEPQLLQRLEDLSRQRGALLVGLSQKSAALPQTNTAVLWVHGQRHGEVERQRGAWGTEPNVSPHAGQLLHLGQEGRVGVLFDTESTLPEAGRALTAAGAEALIVMADGSAYGTTPVAAMLAHRSVIRAVETGRAVLHAGQHGYTQVIDPWGNRLAAPLAPFTPGTMALDLPLYHATTPYVALGDFMFGPLLALCVWGMLSQRRQKASAPQRKGQQTSAAA